MSLPDDVPHTGHQRGPVTEEGPRIPSTETGPRVPATESGRTPTDPPVLPGGGTVTDPPDPTRRTGDGEY